MREKIQDVGLGTRLSGGDAQVALQASSRVEPALQAAYAAALYEFAGPEGAVLMQVGRACPALAAVYAQTQKTSCTFITACHPWGKLVSAELNCVAMQALAAALQAQTVERGWVVYAGEGRDASGHWREASFAVLGMTCAQAQQWGLHWQQNAVLWAGADAVPKLLMLR